MGSKDRVYSWTNPRKRGEAAARLDPKWHADWLLMEARQALPHLYFLGAMTAFVAIMLSIALLGVYIVDLRPQLWWARHVYAVTAGMVLALPLAMLLFAFLGRLLFGVPMTTENDGPW